jgi:hypothetical protein
LRGGRFECREGWFKILDEGFKILIDFENEVKKIYPESNITSDGVMIIKEKFGTMRIQGLYLNGASKILTTAYHELVYSIERTSEYTCEVTGEYGILRTDIPWIQTLCDDEYEKYVIENNKMVEEYREWKRNQN